jgi:hypothetical protein
MGKYEAVISMSSAPTAHQAIHGMLIAIFQLLIGNTASWAGGIIKLYGPDDDPRRWAKHGPMSWCRGLDGDLVLELLKLE